MLTNPRDAFSGQSRSPNIVLFHMLGIFLLCNSNIVFKRRHLILQLFNFKKCSDLANCNRGQRSLKVIESGTIRKIVYGFLLLFFSNIVPKCTVFEIFDFKNAVTLKTGLGVRQGHWKYYHAIQRI